MTLDPSCSVLPGRCAVKPLPYRLYTYGLPHVNPRMDVAVATSVPGNAQKCIPLCHNSPIISLSTQQEALS